MLAIAGRGWQARRDGSLRSRPCHPRLRAFLVDAAGPEGGGHQGEARPVADPLLPAAHRAGRFPRGARLRPAVDPAPPPAAGTSTAPALRGTVRRPATGAVMVSPAARRAPVPPRWWR